MLRRESLHGALLLNVMILDLQYLVMLGLLGQIDRSFKSIFESMNVQLPAMTSAVMTASEFATGPSGWFAALVIIVLGIFGGIWVDRTPEPEIVLPLINALQMIGFLLCLIVSFLIFLPMTTLISGVP